MKSDYSTEDIVKALTEVGVTKGDDIFIHSNIGFFGSLQGAKSKEDYYACFKKAILQVIGEEGTLVVPTFSYSFFNHEVYDKHVTPGVCGFFSEGVREDPDAIRSEDANFSIAAIGKNAHAYTKDAPAHSFGENSFWERLLKNDGKICNFNFDAGSTMIHYVERELDVPYRYDKAFSGVSIIDGNKEEKEFYHYVYDLNKPHHCADFSKFDKRAKEEGLVKTYNLGKGQILLISADDTFQFIKRELQHNPALLIKGDQV